MPLFFGRCGLSVLGLISLSTTLAGCDETGSVEIRQYDPRFAPVVTAKSQTVSKKVAPAVQGRTIRLEVAKDRVLGMHVPKTFKLTRRKPAEAFGQVVAKTRNIKAFYTSLGYQIVDQRVGLRIFPAGPALKEMSPGDKALAKKTYINLVRGKNLVWALHIYAPPPPGMPEKRPDPMEFILQKLNDAPKKPGAAKASLPKGQNGKRIIGEAPTGRAQSVKNPNVQVQRRINYVKPRKGLNVRTQLRKWNKNHPEQPFLD